MKSNIDKIKKLKKELNSVVNEYNSINSNQELSSNIELLNKEAEELNEILNFLDKENAELLKKIELLKKDVSDRIESLASNTPFIDILKKFQKVYGKDCFDVANLNSFFDQQNEDDLISNKEFEIEQIVDSENVFNSLFESEIESIKNISSNKQEFISDNFDLDTFSSFSKEEKLFYIFSRIDELKDKFEISLDLEISKISNNKDIDFAKISLLTNNILDVVENCYNDLKNEFTKKISWDEFVEKETKFNIGQSLFDKKTHNFKNIIKNIEQQENKFKERINELLNSPLKDLYTQLVDKKELSFENYKDEVKQIFESTYNSNFSLFKVKFDLSIDSYLKFIESVEVQIDNIKNSIESYLTKNKETLLINGKEKDLSISKSFFEQLNEIVSDYIEKIKEQKDLITFFSEKFLSKIGDLKSEQDYNSVISNIMSDAKNSLAKTKEIFASLKKELKTEIKLLKQRLQVNKEFETYPYFENIINLITKGLENSQKNLSDDFQDYLDQINEFFTDFLAKKNELISDKLNISQNLEVNNNKLPENLLKSKSSESFKDSSISYGNVNDSNALLISLFNKKIENLEDKFASFANILESINNKLNKVENEDKNKDYIEEISKNINNKFEELLKNLKNEMDVVSENNHNFISNLIENNNKEREFITEFLERINSEYQNSLDELELKKIVESNKKLHDLENLIELQNHELQELLDDKNHVINEIEKAINKKSKDEQNSLELGKAIEEISKNFESKIDNLGTKFNEKLEEINVNSLTSSSTDSDLYREITRNIDVLENKLSANYESVKNSFKENFSEIVDKINTFGESSHGETLNRKIEELNVLIENLKEESKESLQNIAEDLRETTKKDISGVIENFNDQLGNLSEKIENKVDWYENNRQQDFDSLSERLSSKIERILIDTKQSNQDLITNLIENNNREKDNIVSLLNEMDSQYKNTLSELEQKTITEGNRKLQDLEELIVLQNVELQELLDDKNNVINEIENAIQTKSKEHKDFEKIESTLVEISKNFESRIDSLEGRFQDKLEEINSTSQALSSTDNELYREISRNINLLEDQLTKNYESVKTSFKENFNEIITKLGTTDTPTDAINRKIEELNILIENLRDENKSSLENIVQNIDKTSKKNISKAFRGLDNKIRSMSKRLEGKVDWYENNRQQDFDTLSEKLSNRLETLLSNSKESNEILISSLIENNNKEKAHIINLLNEMNIEHKNTLSELEQKTILQNNRRLQEVEDLIILQNNELQELLDDKNNVINEIESAITKKLLNKEDASNIENTIAKISENFESRIDSLETRFQNKLEEINSNSLALSSTDNDLYREISRNINLLENQLTSNYESVKKAFNENFKEIISKIEYDDSSNYSRAINNKIDELNVLVESLKNKNEESLQTIANNLKESSKKDISEMFDNFSDKFGSLSEKIESKVDWYENNRQQEFDNLSEKLSNRIENILKSTKESNEILINNLIESNNKEKVSIVNLLQKIENDQKTTLDSLDELQIRRIAEGNSRLHSLEDLIVLQNNELQELLDDKNEVIREIENALSKRIENVDISKDLERVVSDISKDFESRINNLESRFNEKLEEINVNSLSLSSTDSDLYREITRNINVLENQLSHNYESVKNTFKENFDEIINKIGNGDIYQGESINRKIDELNVLVESLKEKNEQSLQNIEDLKEVSKKDMSQIVENFNDKLGSISERIESKVDWYENNRNQEFNNLSSKLNEKIDNLLTNGQLNNENLVATLIENNNKERQYIVDLLNRIELEHKSAFDELEIKRIADGNKRLQDLEDLILLQNAELQELIDDKSEVVSQIEKAISIKLENNDKSKDVEEIVSKISDNFESRIENLESRFNEKLEEINVNSLMLSSTDNDLYKEITRNISQLENQLTNNYESVKNSFKENFEEIISKLSSSDSGYSQEINRKIDELNVLVEALKDENTSTLNKLSQEISQSTKKDVSKILNSFNKKFKSMSKRLEGKVDWYENNRKDELNNVSLTIAKQIDDLTKGQQENKVLIDNLIENNNKEKEYIVSLLHKIDLEHKETLDELEVKKVMEGNKRLHDLEDLIELQNLELQQLLDDKSEVINQIEKAITRKIENNDTTKNIEEVVSKIAVNFESRIDNLESRFNEKLEEINVNSLMLSSTDNDLYKEITRNISQLENQLTSNYESVKNSFKENFEEIISKLSSSDSGYSDSLSRKVEELNILVQNLKDENKDTLNFVANDLRETSKKDISNVLENINDQFNDMRKEFSDKVSWYQENRANELDDLSKKISERIESLIKEDKQEAKELVFGLIEGNNKEREQIINLLNKIDNQYKSAIDELDSRRILESNEKLHDLEELIELQNLELQELLDDKNDVITEIESAINRKLAKKDNVTSGDLERVILEISNNFDSRIETLESRFNTKLEEINTNSLTMLTTDSDLYKEITRNISQLENQLTSNYESVKNSFKEDFLEIIGNLGFDGYGQNDSLNRKVEELQVLVENLKETNESTLTNLVNNMKESSKEDMSKMFDNFNEKIGSLGEKIESKVNWYENNRQNELNELSKKIDSKLENLMSDIHNNREEDNQKIVDQIIKNNENEKQYILSLINKIDEERQNSINENNLSKVLEANRRMQILEDLILVQNNELQELLDDKNEAINEIERIVLRNKDKLVSQGDSVELKEDISKIVEKFDNKIVSLEKKLEEKFADINLLSQGLDGVVSKEISKSMSELEDKLMSNYESIKNSFKESFQDIENWVMSATDKDSLVPSSPKFEELLNAINELKNSNIAFSSDKFYENIAETLSNELNKFYLNQSSLFENLEHNILSSIDRRVFQNIMDEFEIKLKDLIEQLSLQNSSNMIQIESRLSDDSQPKVVTNVDKDFLNQKINESLSTYEKLLEKSLSVVNDNYANLKDLVIKVLQKDREEFTTSELNKITTLESKFAELEKLILLQDEQTSLLLNEKENLLIKLIQILKEDNQNFDDVLQIISTIDEKVKAFAKVLEQNEDLTKDISEGTLFNETSQISDRVDEMNKYLKLVSQNLSDLNINVDNASVLSEIKNFGNLEFIHSKLINLIDEIQSINENTYSDSQIINKLDELKLDLLSIENDLKLVKMSIDKSEVDSELKEFNIKKSNFIAELIKENSNLIDELFAKKEILVNGLVTKATIENNLNDSQRNSLGILLEAKAGVVFETIFKEIQKIQEQSVSDFNSKIDDLKKKLNSQKIALGQTINFDSHSAVIDKNLFEKIDLIEKNIHDIFDQIENKKNNFLDELDSKISGDNSLVEEIVNKFDKEKESIQQDHEKNRNQLKDLIINFKKQELENYKEKLAKLDSQIKALKQGNIEGDELGFDDSTDETNQKLSLLEDLIENLTLEINSFDEEKNVMFNEMENKINYLEDLNNPLKEGMIELETDNWSSDKFKNIVKKETQDLINSKFQELKKDCDFNIQKIETTIKDLKDIHSQLSEIDKKLSSNTTFEERVENLKDLVFDQPKEIEKNADVQINKKIENYHLKLIDDNVKFYVDQLEKKKIEIANFYKKVRNLTLSREKSKER